MTAVSKVSNDEDGYKLSFAERWSILILGLGKIFSRAGIPATEVAVLGDKSTVQVIGGEDESGPSRFKSTA